ncbi:YbdK family carboxylate-amine ligase [Kocuria marina]|uniref:carboxylate-amine ligase n=1 Tax=Kocuria marina TaxID=223184 RepID=UPI002989C78D|nr:YbdK family carboxylate-amine ligase [Kocuria marina]MCT1722237.1 YbdK family carboxylate-amine ligase [Kocuria marina]MCT1733980.1 YbdK family carboxylate-amine ligase [Kocuria marina]
MSTFGIEEEFLLVDRGDNLPARPTPEQSAQLMSLTAGGGAATPEWLSCQVEETSPVFRDAATAVDSLVEFRTALREATNAMGMDVVGVAAAPDVRPEPAQITHDARYQRLAGQTPAIAADQYISGMHVHLGFPDLEVAVRALNGLRGWLPVLVAIGANSPVWRGVESGFESWRSIHYRRWMTNGVPPHFQDLHDYDSRVAMLTAFDAVESPASLSWLARLSHRHDTLEIRACDVQLEVQDSVAIAVLTRALANYALETPPAVAFTQEYLDIALWQSARWGLSGRLLDPVTATLVPAEELVSTLLERVSGHYTSQEDRRFAEAGVRHILERGNGASRQRRAFGRAGVPGIMALATRAMTAAPSDAE